VAEKVVPIVVVQVEMDQLEDLEEEQLEVAVQILYGLNVAEQVIPLPLVLLKEIQGEIQKLLLLYQLEVEEVELVLQEQILQEILQVMEEQVHLI